MKQRKTLSDWLTNKYLLIIRNEEDFAEKTTYNFTYAKFIVFLVLFFLITVSFALFMFNSVLGKWVDPRYALKENRKILIELTTKLDSLEYEIESKNLFINTFQTMLNGGEVIENQVATKENTLNLEKVNIDYKAPIDSELRKEFEQDAFGLTFSNNKEQDLIDMFFFKPIDGVITQEYEFKREHFAIDIVAKTDEPVKSIADGTVILSSWTEDTGHVLMVQHKNNLVSVYKHNAVLLKKNGSFVEAGEVIAIVGNSGELTSGPHLHFEMWHNGTPLNPLNYINY